MKTEKINIAVLNYNDGNVYLYQDIEFPIDDDIDQVDYVEEFLSEKDFNFNEIEYMFSNKRINIIL